MPVVARVARVACWEFAKCPARLQCNNSKAAYLIPGERGQHNLVSSNRHNLADGGFATRAELDHECAGRANNVALGGDARELSVDLQALRTKPETIVISKY